MPIPEMMISEYVVEVEWFWQEKLRDSEKNLPGYDFVHHKFHTDK